MLKKLLIIASLPESLVNFRGSLIREFCDLGVEVHVAAPDLGFDSAFRRKLEQLNCVVHDVSLRRTGLNPILDFYYFISLYSIIRKVRPTSVFSYTVKPVIYGSIAARVARVDNRFAMITGLGYTFSSKARSSRWLRGVVTSLYRLALHGVKRVFFQNADDELYFLRNGVITCNAPRAVVNGSGVSIVDFDFHPVPFGPPRFLLCARLLVSKGIREYFEAARIIRKRYPTAEFHLAGWIDENPDSISRSELDRAVRNKTIVYHGRLEDVRPIVRDCRVFVLPSYGEGTPRSVLEALAIGRAIITTDVPGCRATVIPGLNGFLVPHKNVETLVVAMEKFILQPELAESMGIESRRLAETKYSVSIVNGQMLRGMGL